ncbi:uncharacterized protein LOC124289138 [Haliotis rubra]|uniref:uncharacterized protein LOC124289138 n=1 Tax=Haliotis rubra TaxID=36100 RepID=UPI001EE52E7F|nr:uncharacterized protein LOC124289138 [Haliotis rubra]
MMFDSDRVNLYRTHINYKGLLVNTQNPEWRGMEVQGTSGKMLKNYRGTCSTSPLPSSNLVYWEVEADVELDKPLGGLDLVLEVGVCGEDVMNSSHFIGDKPNSCSLCLSNDENNVRRFIAFNGKDIATSEVFENKVGTSVTVRYGVLVDTDKMAVSFLDTNKREVLGTGCIADSKPQHSAGYKRKMWPVFAVYSSPKRVEMKLVSGPDLQMDDWKKKLLEDAIHVY